MKVSPHAAAPYTIVDPKSTMTTIKPKSSKQPTAETRGAEDESPEQAAKGKTGKPSKTAATKHVATKAPARKKSTS